MLFSAELSNFKILQSVIRSIANNNYVTIRPFEEGLKLTISEQSSTELSVYVPSEFFISYFVKPQNEDEEILFKINLKLLSDLLNIYGDEGNSYVKLCYQEIGAPLRIIIKHNEENITVDCEIKTMNIDDEYDPPLILADACNANKVVLEADMFYELLTRLDVEADDIFVDLRPNAPHLFLKTTSVYGNSEISISKNCELITLFKCTKPTEATYTFSNIRPIMKVMQHASKVALCTGGNEDIDDDNGLLGMELLIISNSDDRKLYVQYYVTAQCDST